MPFTCAPSDLVFNVLGIISTDTANNTNRGYLVLAFPTSVGFSHYRTDGFYQLGKSYDYAYFVLPSGLGMINLDLGDGIVYVTRVHFRSAL